MQAHTPSSANNSLYIIDDTDTGPSPTDALEALVGAEGDLFLAAETLFGTPKPGVPHPRSRLIALLVSNPLIVEDLQKQLRVLTLIQAFQSVTRVGISVDGALDRMPPSDRAKLYHSLLQVVATLTDDHTVNNNLNANLTLPDQLMDNLTPEEREAMKVLMLPIAGSNGHYTDEGAKEQLEEGTAGWSPVDPPPNAATGTD